MIVPFKKPTGARRTYYQVISHIESYYPDVSIVPGLGELNTTAVRRIHNELTKKEAMVKVNPTFC